MKAKILIVDDRVETLRPLQETLSENPDYKVVVKTSVADGVSALQRYQNSGLASDRFDVAIIDLSFQDTSPSQAKTAQTNTHGFRILEEALKDMLLEPIIITAYGDATKTIHALSKGVFRFIEKRDDAPEPWVRTVARAVDMAVSTRFLALTLMEYSKLLHETLPRLRRDPSNSELWDNSINWVQQLSTATRRYLKFRGKAADGGNGL